MAGMAAAMVSQFFQAQGVKVNELKEDLLRAGFGFEGGSMDIFFKFDDEDKHVHLEGINFLKLQKSKYDSMYRVVNECNATYNHVKFVLDEENEQIVARDDDVIQLDSCGPECFELMIRMVQIVQDAYPKLMKALWA
jgi:hypothetical protein